MKKIIALIAAYLCCCFIGISANAQTTGEITKGNCKVCADQCQKTLDYCTKKGGKYSEANVTTALKDCIQACESAENYIARGSALETKYAALCVDACNSCAKSCESFSADNNMKACADECRKCAGNCSKIKPVSVN